MLLAATETITPPGLSDMLFFQQTEVVFGLVVVLITAGVLLWLFGSQAHRLVVTVLALAIGIVAGWSLAVASSVNVLLGMTIGAVIGASVGYWLFRFWLGVLSSAVICWVLLSLYGFGWARPYLQDAARQNELELARQGLTLRDGPATQPTAPVPATEAEPQTNGQAYRNLLHLTPRLARGHYDNWEQWRQHFGQTLTAVVDNLALVVPRLKLELGIILVMSAIIGMVLAFLKPDFMNIIYTAAIGTVLTISGMAILLSLETTPQSRWFWGHPWTIAVSMLLMAVVGVVLQYYLYGQATSEEGEEDEEEEEAEPAKPSKSGKSKKKK